MTRQLWRYLAIKKAATVEEGERGQVHINCKFNVNWNLIQVLLS